MVNRSVIAATLFDVFAVVSNFPPSSIKETSHLSHDLLLSATLRKGLAHTYTTISSKHGGKRITITEASKLKTVEEAIDLVHKRANS